MAHSATKAHVVTFGKWQAVQWLTGSADEKPVTLKVRRLYVDSKLREYTVGQPHDVTERLFVIQRALHLNDALPGEAPSSQLWRWERGGWLVVDRYNGRVSPVRLPEFDPLYSVATWYRDYVAYCGVSEDGRRVSLTVVQLGRKQPLLHKPLGTIDLAGSPGSACPSPVWFRRPMRVELQMPGGPKLTFSPRPRALDVTTDDEEAEDSD